jgi:hypothetical protein
MEFRDVTVKMKFDNIKIIILNIDGNDVRGIILLQFLQILQDRINLPIPIQENFDIAFDISSGKYIRSD